MKTIILLFLEIFLSTAIFSQSLSVDLNQSKIGWKGTKNGGYHEGTISLKSAQIILNDGYLIGGEFLIDMTGIRVIGDESEDDKKDIIDDVTDKSFFYIEKNKTANFQIQKVSSVVIDEKEKSVEIEGVLTIKGITHSISFPATLQKIKGKYIGSANIKFDRQMWKLGFSGFSGIIKERVLNKFIEIHVKIISK